VVKAEREVYAVAQEHIARRNAKGRQGTGTTTNVTSREKKGRKREGERECGAEGTHINRILNGTGKNNIRIPTKPSCPSSSLHQSFFVWLVFFIQPLF